MDKQGDTLIAHNSILQSTTLKYKNLTSCVKILVSGLSRISSSCSSDTSRLAGGAAYNVTHTINTHYVRTYVHNILYIYNMHAMSTVANTNLVNTTQLLLSETSAAHKLLNPPPFQPIKHRALHTTHNPYVRMVCPPQ